MVATLLFLIATHAPVLHRSLAIGPKLVCVGDSITEGGVATKPEYSYVGRLRTMAAEAHVNLEIINDGLSGWTTGNFADNAAKLVEKLPADATTITIMLGTNDSRSTHDAAQVAADAVKNLEKVMDIYHAKAPNARFVLITPPALYPSKYTPYLRSAHYDESSVVKVAAIDAAYKKLAEQRHLQFIDISFLPGIEYSPDGVHPDDFGHAKVAQKLWRELNKD